MRIIVKSVAELRDMCRQGADEELEGTRVKLAAFGDNPEQRAEVLGYGNGVLTCCVDVEDRVEGDHDGLCEVPLDQVLEVLQ